MDKSFSNRPNAGEGDASAGSFTVSERQRQEVAKQKQHVMDEQMARDPIIAYVEELKANSKVENPLEYPLVWGTAE